jgi:hypothetical protein
MLYCVAICTVVMAHVGFSLSADAMIVPTRLFQQRKACAAVDVFHRRLRAARAPRLARVSLQGVSATSSLGNSGAV